MCHLPPETVHAQFAEQRRGSQPITMRLVDGDPIARRMALEVHMH